MYQLSFGTSSALILEERDGEKSAWHPLHDHTGTKRGSARGPVSLGPGLGLRIGQLWMRRPIKDCSPQPALSVADWVIEGEARPSTTARRAGYQSCL